MAKKLIALSEKYQCDAVTHALQARILQAINLRKLGSWRYLVFACDREWEDVARAAIRNFGRCRFNSGHGPSLAPEHLPLTAIRKLRIEHFAAYVRAYNSTVDASEDSSVNWDRVAEAFSFEEPE
jgi:hypothetical protein